MPNGINNGCPFCIMNGKVSIIADNEVAYLIKVLDHRTGEPKPGCYFIIPKKHVEHWLEAMALDGWGDAVSHLLGELLMQEGVNAWVDPHNVSFNQGHEAGQRVTHAHMWVIARSQDESLPSFGKGMNALVDEADLVTSAEGEWLDLEDLRACALRVGRTKRAAGRLFSGLLKYGEHAHLVTRCRWDSATGLPTAEFHKESLLWHFRDRSFARFRATPMVGEGVVELLSEWLEWLDEAE